MRPSSLPPAAAWADRFEVDPADRELIFGEMRAWLADVALMPSYDDLLVRWGCEFEMYRHRWDRGDWAHDNLDREVRQVRLYQLRHDWIREFGFAIPCAGLIDVLKGLAPVVEIGSGTGYLTALARAGGVDIIGTDWAAGGGDGGHGFVVAAHDRDQVRLAGKTAVRRFRDRTVLCSWPTLDHTWFRQALRAMRIGQRLVVVREEACADDSAWDYLDCCFQRERKVMIPAWPLLNDRCEVWRKRRQRA